VWKVRSEESSAIEHAWGKDGVDDEDDEHERCVECDEEVLVGLDGAVPATEQLDGSIDGSDDDEEGGGCEDGEVEGDLAWGDFDGSGAVDTSRFDVG